MEAVAATARADGEGRGELVGVEEGGKRVSWMSPGARWARRDPQPDLGQQYLARNGEGPFARSWRLGRARLRGNDELVVLSLDLQAGRQLDNGASPAGESEAEQRFGALQIEVKHVSLETGDASAEHAALYSLRQRREVGQAEAYPALSDISEPVHDSLGELGEGVVFVPHDLCEANEVGYDGRLEALESGHDVAAEAVAGESKVEVGAVEAIGKAVGAAAGLGLNVGDSEEGADDPAANGRDAGEAAGAGAAEKVEENGLGLVVPGVAGGDAIGAPAVGGGLEPLVAKLAGGDLEGEVMSLRVGGRVDAVLDERNA